MPYSEAAEETIRARIFHRQKAQDCNSTVLQGHFKTEGTPKSEEDFYCLVSSEFIVLSDTLDVLSA